MSDLPALTAEEYWKWRTTIEEMNVAKAKKDNAVLQHQLFQRDAEIVKYKGILHQRTTVIECVEQVAQAEKEYARVKEEIENRLGVSLNGKMIDETSYEVKELPVDNNSNKGG